MVCSDDIKAKVKQVLKLPGQPVTTSAFANQIYTCTYHLPVGLLVLSVQHSAAKVAANAYYDHVSPRWDRPNPCWASARRPMARLPASRS